MIGPGRKSKFLSMMATKSLDLQNYNLDTLRGRIAINTLATLMMAVAGAQASQARSQSSV